MKETLAGGEDLKISGFGIIKVRKKSDRCGRNPQTGESITIKVRRVLTFKPSTLLKQAMNQELE
jgi:integration host factor subunit alpha